MICHTCLTTTALQVHSGSVLGHKRNDNFDEDV